MAIQSSSSSVISQNSLCRSSAYGFNHIVLNEVIKAPTLTCILHNPLVYFKPAYGAVIWNLIVHTTVLLAAIHSSVVHITTFEYIHKGAVFLVEDKVAPRHIAHLAGKGEVLEPAQGLEGLQFKSVRAAGTAATLYECIVVDVLIPEFSESVSSGFVLDNSTEVKRIAVV